MNVKSLLYIVIILLLFVNLPTCARGELAASASDAAASVSSNAENDVAEDDLEASTEDVPSAAPARAYVLVCTAEQTGWLPLPDEGELTYSLKQLLPDGNEAENVIHLTPEGMYVESATCANHDCIDQGMVTLANRDERVLGNMIICLPNQVVLYLYTPEEVLALVQGQQ